MDDSAPKHAVDWLYQAALRQQLAIDPSHGVTAHRGQPLSSSERVLGALYAGDFVPSEKKPMVVDTRRSIGPYMASIDEPALTVLDACSQIATLTHGFRNPWIVRDHYSGRFDDVLASNPDSSDHRISAMHAFANALRVVAPPGLAHVCFVAAGGAEANEKALRIARLVVGGSADARRRVMAFRGGFHGRTWAALMATSNPAKRGGFELSGFESVFSEADLTGCEQPTSKPRPRDLRDDR